MADKECESSHSAENPVPCRQARRHLGSLVPEGEGKDGCDGPHGPQRFHSYVHDRALDVGLRPSPQALCCPPARHAIRRLTCSCEERPALYRQAWPVAGYGAEFRDRFSRWGVKCGRHQPGALAPLCAGLASAGCCNHPIEALLFVRLSSITVNLFV